MDKPSAIHVLHLRLQRWLLPADVLDPPLQGR